MTDFERHIEDTLNERLGVMATQAARIAKLEMALYAIANICLVTCLRPGIEAQKMQSIAVAALIKCDCDGQCKSYGQCISKARATVTGGSHEATSRP